MPDGFLYKMCKPAGLGCRSISPAQNQAGRWSFL